jgi:uncharacterized protein YggE
MPAQTDTISIPAPGRRAAWLAIGLAIGLVVAGIASPAFSPRSIQALDPNTPIEHTISVSGTGSVILTPDTADLHLGVMKTASTVMAVRAAAATSMTAVIASLKKLGIAEADIQTTTLSLQPTYDYSANTNPPRLTGYQLTNTVAVTIRDLDKVGDAIDNAIAAGATSLDGVSFRVADQTAAEKQARDAAMAQAKSKAQALAAAAGVSITGVSSISESASPVPYPIYYGGMAASPSKDVATPVQVGTTEISIMVAVVYVIN